MRHEIQRNAAGFELATLISAARCVVEERQGELTADARRQLEQVLEGYDRQRQRKLAAGG